jgi:hypothetical protein
MMTTIQTVTEHLELMVGSGLSLCGLRCQRVKPPEDNGAQMVGPTWFNGLDDGTMVRGQNQKEKK